MSEQGSEDRHHSECKYFRLRRSDEGIFYECQHFESEVEFNDAICEQYTTEKDIFNMWG